ncbi:hypothetical protein VitviT2T_015736 [Vitis vinifera]|uniref:Uncharacterized protein n=1 Tax=Vitis vinifera TaxID=29760 RepID=A0ABY9CR01_VITVI|nr:hypothetical protein VitviT2T_015736 [Vitis vinifera]
MFKKKMKFRNAPSMPRNDPKGFQPLENSDISKKKKSSSSTIDRIVDLLAGNSQQNDSSSLEEDYGRNALSKESSLLQNHGKKLEKGREGKKIGGIVNPEFRNGDQVKGETKNSQSFTKENQNTVTKPNVILSRNGNSNCRKVGRKPVAKGSRDKSSDIKADLWWLHFLYVIVVLIQRGSNHEGQSGLYTLKTTSHESDPIDSSCTVAFEDCDLHEVVDPTFFSCLLQPSSADSDPQYIGICHLLLYRKAKSGVHRWKDWRCNGKGYVAYWNYIAPLSLLFEVDNWSFSRDLRSGYQASSHKISFSSSASDNDLPIRNVQPAYSFVEMHCIFDQCKASVIVLKFGNKSSDLLAYGAADGNPT